jgi:PadR family transcriptional regulator, regulatory protein AphA
MMTEPQRHAAVRNGRLLRLFPLPALEADDARILLRETFDSGAGEAAELRETMARDATEPSERKLPFGRLAAAFGLRNYEMRHDWARWALAELDKVERHTGADRTKSR